MDLATAYRDAHQRIVELARDLGDEEADRTPVPACPRWSVKDLVAHMAGVGADALSGDTDPGLGEEWTQGHVDARADAGLATVVHDWSDIAPEVARLVEQADESTAAGLVTDVITHEQDLRGALRRPGARDDEVLAVGATFFAQMLGEKLQERSLAPLTLESADDDGWRYLAGGPQDGEEGWQGGTNAAVGVRAPLFELHRALSGRRSAEQVRDFAWTDDPEPYLPLLSAFGPLRDDDLAE